LCCRCVRWPTTECRSVACNTRNSSIELKQQQMGLEQQTHTMHEALQVFCSALSRIVGFGALVLSRSALRQHIRPQSISASLSAFCSLALNTRRDHRCDLKTPLGSWRAWRRGAACRFTLRLKRFPTSASARGELSCTRSISNPMQFGIT
jgi:hypothetical protein